METESRASSGGRYQLTLVKPIGWCIFFLLIFFGHGYWESSKSRELIHKLIVASPDYQANREMVEEIFSSAHWPAARQALSLSPGQTRGFSINYNESTYIQTLFAHMYADADRRSRPDIHLLFYNLHTLIHALEPKLPQPSPPPPGVKALIAAEEKKKAVEEALNRPPPPETDIIKVRLEPRVLPKFAGKILFGYHTDLFARNPEGQPPGCYTVAHDVKLASFLPKKDGSAEAVIELDMLQVEPSQVYLRIKEELKGRQLCVGLADKGAPPMDGYTLNSTDENCRCDDGGDAETATHDETIALTGVGSVVSERSAAGDPGYEERMRRNLGVDARAERREAERRSAERLAAARVNFDRQREIERRAFEAIDRRDMAEAERVKAARLKAEGLKRSR